MGVEIAEEHGGAGMSFMSAILMIEELAKIDPAVSVVRVGNSRWKETGE